MVQLVHLLIQVTFVKIVHLSTRDEIAKYVNYYYFFNYKWIINSSLLLCLKDIDVCTPNPCQNGGTCLASSDSLSYTCKCSTGFSGFNCQRSIFQKIYKFILSKLLIISGIDLVTTSILSCYDLLLPNYHYSY